MVDRLLPLRSEGVSQHGAEGLYATPKLADRERLGDVVVSAELETEHGVELVVSGREHDDRHRALAANPPADLETVYLRQHQVENDEVDLLLAEQPERLLTVPSLDDPVAVPLERVREQRLDRVLVVDEKDCRGVGHPCVVRAARASACRNLL